MRNEEEKKDEEKYFKNNLPDDFLKYCYRLGTEQEWVLFLLASSTSTSVNCVKLIKLWMQVNLSTKQPLMVNISLFFSIVFFTAKVQYVSRIIMYNAFFSLQTYLKFFLTVYCINIYAYTVSCFFWLTYNWPNKISLLINGSLKNPKANYVAVKS